MKNLFLIALIFFSPTLFAQVDSIPYSREFEFREGIFLTIEQFRKNAPVPKSYVVSEIPKSQVDFLRQVTEQKYLTIKDTSDKEQKIETKSIWGYCQNRTIYINFNREFNRVNLIGSLCHLTAVITQTAPFNDPMNSTYGINTSYDELRQFVLDVQTNRILDFNVKNMEPLLSRDNELYHQFMALKKKEKANSIFMYLRRYNEKHPLYLSAQ